jgi:hypothetical protein
MTFHWPDPTVGQFMNTYRWDLLVSFSVLIILVAVVSASISPHFKFKEPYAAAILRGLVLESISYCYCMRRVGLRRRAHLKAKMLASSLEEITHAHALRLGARADGVIHDDFGRAFALEFL